MLNEFVVDKYNYSKDNLSYKFFNNVQATHEGMPLDFTRADFRGSKFKNCTFKNNSFDRADFIDSILEDVTFSDVNFGMSLFKNSYFNRSIFISNRYNNISIQESTFQNCYFETSHILCVLFNCKFIDCIFKNVEFNQSSIDSNTFIDCTFISCNMAECHMENIKFESCLLRHVDLGISYISTYLMRNTDISAIQFKYRGEIQNIYAIGDEELNKLFEQERYFNYMNLRVLLNRTENFYEEIEHIVTKVLKLAPQLRYFNMKNLLLMFEFYYSCAAIDFLSYQKSIIFLNSLNFDDLPFEESLEYKSILYKINQINNFADISLPMVKTIDVNTECLCTIHIKSTDEQTTLMQLNDVFKLLNAEVLENLLPNDSLYEIKSIQKGSIILIISSSLLLATLFVKVAKSINNDIQQIRLEKAVVDETIKSMKEGKKVKQSVKTTYVETSSQLITNENKYSQALTKLSNSILIGEIISIVISLII